MSRLYSEEEWNAREIDHLKQMHSMSVSMGNLVECLRLARQEQVASPVTLILGLNKPQPIIEQMAALSPDGRCFGGHFNKDGDVEYFIKNLTYRDKLVLQDVIVQNINLHFRQVNGYDEEG